MASKTAGHAHPVPDAQGLNPISPAARITARCSKCGQDRTLDHFTMSGRRTGHDTRVFCNACEIESDPYAFDRTAADSAWMDLARCADGAEPEVFFPHTMVQLEAEAWRPFCDGCQVRDQCLQHGLAIGATGVWGGQHLDVPMRKALRAVRLPARELDEIADSSNKPGARLLARGSCLHGHEIKGYDDLVIYRKGPAAKCEYLAICKVCVRNRERPKEGRTLEV